MDANALYKLLQSAGVDNLRIRGANITGCCMFHEETRPSWGISVHDPHMYGCFGCGAKGSLLGLLRHLGYAEDHARRLCNTGDGSMNLPELEQPDSEKAEIDYTELYPFKWTKQLRVYCNQRRIDADALKAAGVVYHPPTNRMLFPWKFSAKLVGVTGRALDDNLVKTLPLFGTKKGDWLYLPGEKIKRDTLVLVEGEIDAWFVYSQVRDFADVGALGFGSFTKNQQQLIRSSKWKNLILFFDDDTTGKRLTDLAIQAMRSSVAVTSVDYSEVRCNRIYRDVKLDPAELIGIDASRMVRQAKSSWGW